MRTQLSHFCEQFVTTVRPVLEPLDRALATLEQESESETPGHGLRSGLTELGTQLRLLSDKVEKQRAYVLIFGPLKSGKSTLMNAIAGSYVSEVSSLPAYPSLVFVSHGDKPEFVVTSYNGETKTYKDTTALGKRIDDEHDELALNIRSAENAGEMFDPEHNFPQAIQRVDVKVPAENLKESGAVLVDTPGLYTRMRFGYDRMTRDFRNAAACAIFVVKSDTLFLEQVFAEFTQLLELFSRIFLVVNMDTTKRDLDPKGNLVPSLEQKSPARIVEVFERLAMPHALKQATASGRLRIFPIDLLKAASNALQGKDTTQDFVRFRKDFEDYLESTEYLKAFLSDSLRRAEHLVAETSEISMGSFTQQLRADVDEADSKRTAVEEERRMLSDCQNLDWGPAFKRFEKELSERLQRTSHDVGARIARDMSAAIETWILSSHSLEWLFETVWQPLFQEYVQAVRDSAERCFEQSVYQDNAGLDFDQDLVHFLDAIDVAFRPLRHAAYSDMAEQEFGLPTIPLEIDDIPVRRGIMDMITFRSEDRVRQRLFGKNASNKISARQKAKRLGEPAKKFFNQFLLNFRDEFFPETIAETHDRYGGSLCKATVAKLHEVLESRRPGLDKSISDLAARADQIRKILSPVEELQAVAETVGSKIHALDSQFSSTDASAILSPMPPRAPSAEARKSRREPSS
jgi:GTPase SAR1 family protein